MQNQNQLININEMEKSLKLLKSKRMDNRPRQNANYNRPNQDQSNDNAYDDETKINYFREKIKSKNPDQNKIYQIDEDSDLKFKQLKQNFQQKLVRDDNMPVNPLQKIQNKSLIQKQQKINDDRYSQINQNQFNNIVDYKSVQKQPINQQNFQSSLNHYKNTIDNRQINDEIQQTFECSQGCGRKFNQQALIKHENICKQVFQKKRKEFNMEQQRLADFEINKILTKPSKVIKNSGSSSTQKSKWQKQSEQFRASIKAAKGVELTVQEQQNFNQMGNDDLILCQYCNRKFNQQAAQKHIPFCQEKQLKDNFKNKQNIQQSKNKWSAKKF